MITQRYITKDSFNYHFCDDLCQVILERLTAEDTIRLMAVSKQFNRCLRHLCHCEKSLNIVDSLVYDSNSSDGWLDNCVDIIKLENFLKSFKRLNEVTIGCQLNNMNHVFNTIIDNCLHLKGLRLYSKYDIQDLMRVIVKFGQQLQTLELWPRSADSQLISLCPNLVSLSGVYLDVLVQNNEVLTKNLKYLRVSGRSGVDNRLLFSIFVAKCHKLIHLDISLYKENTDEVSPIVAEIAKLKYLKILSIHLNVNTFDDKLAKNIKLIANNCQYLESFAMTAAVQQYYDFRILFKQFTNFSSVTKLNFWSIKGFHSDCDQLLDITSIANCRHLTHLVLNSDQINGDFLDQIPVIFPYLKCLKVDTIFEITDNTLEWFSRLKHLQVLNIKSLHGMDLMSMTESSLMDLIVKCKHLRTLEVHNRIVITESLINLLIQKADQNSGIYFRYYFKDIDLNTDLNAILSPSGRYLNNITIKG